LRRQNNPSLYKGGGIGVVEVSLLSPDMLSSEPFSDGEFDLVLAILLFAV